MKIISIKYILLLILLYIYLYNPIFQLFDFGLIKIVLFISVIYIILSKKVNFFITLFRKEIIFSLILIIYSSISVVFGDGTAFKVPYTHVVWFLECFIIPFFFIFFFEDIFKKKSWESIIVHTGLIASLITLFLILNPNINFFIRDSVIRDSLSDFSNKIMNYRGFAISENSVYSYGIVQGLILSICLISLQKTYLYAIPMVFLFVSILFNARIGFAGVIIAFSLILLSRQIKIINILALGVVFYLGYIFLFHSAFSQNNLDSLKWGFSFFEDTSQFINGQNNNSNYSVLVDQMIFSPSGIFSLIFGEGRIVFGTYKGSDIGYVNQIFIGGIIYLFLMLSFLFYMFKTNIKSSTNKLFPILFFLTLLVVNIKGDALFVSNGFFRLIAFYYIYCIILKRTNHFRPINTLQKHHK